LPGLDAATYAAMGGAAALLLFASALVHEMTHAAVATARGCRPRVILLLVYGGLWDADTSLPASDEFLISIAGPLSSFVVVVAGECEFATAVVAAQASIGPCRVCSLCTEFTQRHRMPTRTWTFQFHARL
jgi:Zn-dependent protease